MVRCIVSLRKDNWPYVERCRNEAVRFITPDEADKILSADIEVMNEDALVNAAVHELPIICEPHRNALLNAGVNQ